MRGGQPLSKNVSRLVACRDKTKIDILVQDLFPNEVVINFNMLSSSMIYKIRS
jgi:hypothetical protein